jgi:hypothetical protein
MERDVFLGNLLGASARCRASAARFVLDPLPDQFVFWVELNRSYDGDLNAEHEVVFPDDIEKHGERVGPLAAEAVVDLLWRDRRVPEWIDMLVVAADAQATTIELTCCGRFTSRFDFLYYNDTPTPPFGVMGPAIPPRLTDAAMRGDPIEKFTLAESRGEA